MASISSTDSIGNTSLRGYGGMASGIDRDSIIEKMTLGTTTKINNQKSKITQLEWKQEAYRNISDQIIDFGDKYTSFSSTDSLIDPNFFAKNIITVNGRDEATRFVTASGSSELIDTISIKGVEQLATSTVRQSSKHVADGIKTSLGDLNEDWRSSNLKGSVLVFETKGANDTTETTRLLLPDGYTDDDGKTHEIDYTTTDLNKLVGELNEALKSANIKIGNEEASQLLKFVVSKDDSGTETGHISLQFQDGKNLNGYKVYGTAMVALGYTNEANDRIEADQTTLAKTDNRTNTFEQTGIAHKTALKGMEGAKLTIDYDGSKKEIELVTKEELAKMKESGLVGEDNKVIAGKEEEVQKRIEANLKSRLTKAFGKDMVTAEFIEKDGKTNLTFKTANDESTISIVSNDYALLKNLGISYGESNKVNLNGKLDQASILNKEPDWSKFVKKDDAGVDTDTLDLRINGEEIKGLTKDSSINDILKKINDTTAAGVKATYVSSTGQFMLVSSETGAGREISLDSDLAKELFGTFKKENDERKYIDPNDPNTTDKEAGISAGQDAIIHVSYGNGVDVPIKRASNSFNLEGLDVKVTGTFGGKVNDAGEWEADASQTVTFTAKADVDGIVERVKGFFEDFNKLATDINNEITTRPDSSYGPLTDEQKAEMDETSIENWEKKAKQGMLYGDSAMRDLSTDVQGIFLKLMNSLGRDGFEKLKEMGITYSDDYGDGGTISFDESKFRTAVEKDSEAVGNLFTGGGNVSKGLIAIMDETFTPYATRYASKNGNGGKGSYGRLIEIAGSEKKPTTLLNNQIYNEIKDMNDLIARLQEQLKTEQDRYISQFTTMESLLNQMNTQSSYLSQLTG